MKRFHFLFVLIFFVYLARAEHWENYTISQRNVNNIAIDNDTMWIGSYEGGVAKYLLNGTLLALYNKADGLVSNNIGSIAIDRQGNKWFNGGFGISKFDGNSWTNYYPSDSIKVGGVLAIDSLNNLWCGTDADGISKFDGSHWTNYNTSNSGIAGNAIQEIMIDSHNNVWVGTNGSGVSKFDGTNWTTYTTSNSGLSNGDCGRIAEDAQGSIWFTASDWPGGVSKFDGTNWVTYTYQNSPLPNYPTRNITVDAQGNKWIATYGKLFKFDGTAWTKYDNTNSPFIGEPHDIKIDKYQNKWIAWPGGIFKLDVGGNWSLCDTANYGLGHAYLSVWSIGVDLIGDKWFGTEGYGALKYSNNQLTKYTTTISGFSLGEVFKMAIDADNNKWFISQWNNRVSKFDGTNWNVYTVPSSGDGLRSIVVDKTDITWVGTDSGGVAKFDGANWTNYTIYNSGLAGKGVPSMAIDTLNTKWFGTYNGGLSKFDGTNWTTFNTSNSNLPNNYVSAIEVDSTNNDVWVGTWGSGACLFDGTNWTIYDTSNSGIADNYIWDIAVDKNGNKWFATYTNGVSKFDGVNWTNYDVINSGLSKNNVIGMTIDQNNNKWFATGNVSVLVEDDNDTIFRPYVYTGLFTPLEEFLKIYPNPSRGEINFQTKDDTITDVSIYNLTGALVNSFSQPQITLLDLSQFESGVYLVKVKFGGKSVTRRWVKL